MSLICPRFQSCLLIVELRCWMAPWVYIGLQTAAKFTKLLCAAPASCCPRKDAPRNILHLNELPLSRLTQKHASVNVGVRQPAGLSRLFVRLSIKC